VSVPCVPGARIVHGVRCLSLVYRELGLCTVYGVCPLCTGRARIVHGVRCLSLVYREFGLCTVYGVCPLCTGSSDCARCTVYVPLKKKVYYESLELDFLYKIPVKGHTNK
jgi:hypothetical protein